MIEIVDRVLGWGRIVKAVLSGDLNAIVANVTEYRDDEGQDIGGADEQRVFGVVGHYARPDPPSSDGEACEVVFARTGDGAEVIASRDLRATQHREAEEGELGLGHYGGGALRFTHRSGKDGTRVELGGTKTSNGSISASYLLTIDPDNNAITIEHADGHKVELKSSGDVVITSKDGANTLTVSTSKIEASAGQTLKVSASSVECGGSQPLVLLAPFVAWAATVVSAVNGLAPGSLAAPVAPGTNITKGA